MTDKERYVQEKMSEHLQFWIGMFDILAVALFMFIGIADYFVTPENFKRFLILRTGVSCCLGVLFYLNTLKRNLYYQHAIITIIIILCTLTVEYMVLHFGGHASTYYAGILLTIVGAFGFIAFNMYYSIVVAILIYALYNVPILLLDTITDLPTYIANNIFMLSMFSISLTLRVLSQKNMVRSMELQYDLAQEKQKLELYSNQLEVVVKERTQELQKSEQWHRSLFENATDGIVVLNQQGIIVDANEKACLMHGFSKRNLVGTHIALLEADHARNISDERRSRILEGNTLVYETSHHRKDGTPLRLEISTKSIKIGDELLIQSFYRDITEKKQLQDHLQQSQKMESIGVLAGGIAHDFNNMLTAVLIHTSVIRRNADLKPKALNSVQVIEDISKSTGKMISNLLGFARGSTFTIQQLHLNAVIQDTIKMLDRIIGKGIDLKLELAEELPTIQGDFDQLKQVIMNLIVNAQDAMPDGGRIVITTKYRNIQEGTPDVPPYILPGGYAQMSVSDTGNGIPEDLQQKIFEPFFTTKERGKGTGLGLSMVYGTIKEHYGHITVHSKLGAGSTFTVYLPVSREDLPQAPDEIDVPINGNETILFVDDESHIASAAEDTLADHGYRVIASTDPVKALELFAQHHRDISLVITDIVMPQLDGIELIRRIRSIKPEVRIIAISGYKKHVEDKKGVEKDEGVSFLQKPFEVRDLLIAIRHSLNGGTMQ
jgi:two-component system cell cycle sensor histidine kinase/response regulator CckA